MQALIVIIVIIALIILFPAFFLGLLAIAGGLIAIGIWLLPTIFILWILHYIVIAIVHFFRVK